MRLRTTRCLVLAALALEAANSQELLTAPEEHAMGILAIPSFFYTPETGLGGGGMVMLTKPLAGGDDGRVLANSMRAGHNVISILERLFRR